MERAARPGFVGGSIVGHAGEYKMVWQLNGTCRCARYGTEAKRAFYAAEYPRGEAGARLPHSLRINPDTRRETNHFDLSPVTAVTVVTRSTVLCRFQQSKNVSICISKYGIW